MRSTTSPPVSGAWSRTCPAHQRACLRRDTSAADKSSGLHNYLHYRFQDAKSKIDIGDPSVNLQNKRFWRLHGWIERRWTEFRKIKNLSEQDPKYLAALKKGEDMLAPKLKLPGDGTTKGLPEAPPESLRKFFTKDL